MPGLIASPPHIWLAVAPVDMRKCVDGLSAIVRQALESAGFRVRVPQLGGQPPEAVAVGRKRRLVVLAPCPGAVSSGSQRAAAIQTLLGTAKLNGLNPAEWLKLTLEKLPAWPNSCIDELLLFTPEQIRAIKKALREKAKCYRWTLTIMEAYSQEELEALKATAQQYLGKVV